MSDLIDRDALRLMKVKECAGHTIEYAEGWKACIEWIKTLPSAEPERKKGKWIDTGWRITYKCSECGNYLDLSGVNAGRGDANFCPNCGAEMARGGR